MRLHATPPLRGAVAKLALPVVLAAALSAPPPAAQAFELFGKCLFGTCKADDEDGPIDPKNYQVALTVLSEGEPDRDLRKAVASASLLWQQRGEAAAGSAGLLTRAKADYKRILASLYNDGRYAVEISISWNGREVSNIPAGTELPDGIELAVTVDAQRRFQFGTAEIENSAPPPTDRHDRVDLPKDEGFVSGAPAYATAVKRAEALALEAWRQQGYAHAEISDRRVTANHQTQELNVRLTVEPGPRAVYGPVEVTGTDRMRAQFVARQTGLIPGAEYDPDDLKRAEQRLQRLGVFQAVSLKEAGPIGRDGALPMMLTVQERKLRRIGVGASVSSVDGVGVEGYWLHRNLFGRAERLRVDGRVSGIGTTMDFQKLDYFLGAELTLPGRFTPDTDIVIGGYFEREVLDLYTKDLGSASVYATHFYSDEITLKGGTYVTYGEYDDVFGQRRFGVIGAEASVEYDTRDNELDAKSGVYARAAVEPFYEWEYGNVVGKAEAEARVFRALDADERTILAARLKVGAIVGAPISEIPHDELFLAGGGASVRGYPYRSIGVDVPGGTSGGRALFEASAEVRRDITDSIGVVGFVDLGHVSSGSFPDFSDDLKIGAGAGLRYDTGLGPIRLDVAVPVNHQSGDPSFAIYAGIGQAF
ncbi:autotransporter assembly complex family protein [Oricola sp.]|uniref:autotransporter assembly complex protein TamA n=1 Tax=Oricola sp. TaxID=1979950 RepID=UPI0025D4ED8E|nr:autotransporter assembly complex family protein [Oricola sp.]MCI5073580.1 autotransporter assembly complex protein TamA [Oricola sp.]